MKRYYDVEIPKNHRIYEQEFGIEGIQYKKDNFHAVNTPGAKLVFALKRDKKNPKDANAISIIAIKKGFFWDTEKPIGYVPAKIAAYIADTGLIKSLVIRPKRSYVSDDGFIEFSFDILGPKDKYDQYKSV
ncbi:hypothetical protein EOL70_02310 [Leucothrix sargassi]|nr:hypothetical protein EOL70_02310 [Leucothrix sargassi]